MVHLRGINMMVIIKMDCLMEKEFTIIKTEIDMREIGKKDIKMEVELNI